MDATTATILSNCFLSPEDIAKLEEWWKKEGLPEEDVVTFLVRQGYFSESAPILIDLVCNGTVPLQPELWKRLLSPERGMQLRERLRSMTTTSSKATTATESDLIYDTKSIDAIEGLILPHGLQKGSIVGKYMLLEQIGQGANGVVYRAHHQVLNIPVAIKFLCPNYQNEPSAHEMFRQEAQLLAQINHPNVLRVWDFDYAGEYPYLVLEYVQGMSLEELVRQSGRLQTEHATNIILQACQGLRAAQRVGIIHRDVKPANLLITRDSCVKVSDFGLALTVHTQGGEPGTAQVKESFAGTAAYASPEQALSSSVDHRSDIYSLGATFYYILTGKPPFSGTWMVVLIKHIQEMPTPPHEVIPGVPPEVSDVILKMMAKNPEHRYQSYDECIVALEHLLQKFEKFSSDHLASSIRSTKESLWGTLKARLLGLKTQ
jgi:serine/threonine protein kinase